MKPLSRCVFAPAVALALSVLLPGTTRAAVIEVPATGDLQAALNSANPGDTIVLPAGARFVGQFHFPAKAGMVTLTSSGPLPSGRISPAAASALATIASGMSSMAIDMYGARNWTLDGIRFEPNSGGYGEIIGIQGGENIVLRRLLLVVPSTQEQKRFVLGNGRNITLTESHCSGVWRSGQDSQCFVAWDGAGPYKITNNFLEAASENVMFGGADSVSPDNVPSDILVENNLFTKRLEWKGFPRGVKNIFELKAARRVIVRNNVFEHNWIDAQGGSAIVFTPRNQDGGAPWTVVEDVLFEYNIVRDTPAHFNVLGYDNIHPSGQTTRITIRHNLLLGAGGGRMATIGNEVGDLVFDHNTYVNPQTSETSMVTLYAEGTIATATGSRAASYAVTNFTFTNNMANGNTYGLHSSVGFGLAGLTGMTRGYVWTNNVIAGGWGTYPSVTTLLPLAEYPGQFDVEYHLASTSAFKSMATDGTDLGWGLYAAPPPPTTDPAPAPAPPPATLPVQIVTGSLSTGRTSTPYSAALTATGGSGTFRWSLTSGSLPAGLTLDAATGAIIGTPTQSGAKMFTVQAADAADPKNIASADYGIEVTAPISVVTTTLPAGLRGRAYQATLAATNAQGPVRWTVASGKLPPGLTLDAATGSISGKPNSFGTWTFTVAASDASSSGSQSLTLTVARK